jgi:hypothetical protein
VEELAGYVTSVADHLGAEYLSLKIVVPCQEIRSHGKALFRAHGGEKKRHSFQGPRSKWDIYLSFLAEDIQNLESFREIQ